MRPSLAEWLLLPLLALPLLASAGFCLYVRQSHYARIEDYRQNGAKRIVDWMEREPGWVADCKQRFRKSLEPGEKDVRFSIDGEPGRVRLAGTPASTAPWRFTRDYAGSYPPAALATSDARIAIESGKGGPYLEPGAVAFAHLLGAPNLAALRAAPLPAASKLYLLHHWPDDYSEDEAIVRAARCVGPRPFGVHPVDGFFVLSDGATQVISIARPHSRFGDPVSRDGRFRLRYEQGPGGPTPRTATEIWRGRLDEPIAGEWTIEALDAGMWWFDPLFRRWVWPLAVAQIALFLIPFAILLAIRKQRRLDEARVRFINELAHDLRTPLTSVRMHAELLALGRAPEGEQDRYVSVLARESARLSGLLSNLLDLSRLERGSRVFTKEPVPVRTAVDEAVRDFVSLYPEREHDVTVAGDDSAVVFADRDALARCLANLLDNAGKYTAAGTPVRIEWDGACVRVSDEGPGVSAADRAGLFRRYVRGRDVGRSGVPGTGMGLALVRELAEGMGGSVGYEPRARGACFVLRFPDG